MFKSFRAVVVRTALAVWAFAASTGSIAGTQFFFTSSPASWVGNGETVSVTPEMGFDFTANRNFDNGISFAVNNFSSSPFSSRWWYLDFSAPFDAPLAAGSYLGATRWPFQAAENPGLSFSGNGAGNNTLTGLFNVLEVVYGPGGSVSSFAVDFLQYDEGIDTWWNLGSLRYNSNVPISLVPEPMSWAMFAAGLVGLAMLSRRRGAA